MQPIHRGVVWALWVGAAILAFTAYWPTLGLNTGVSPVYARTLKPVPYTVALQETVWTKNNVRLPGARTVTAVRPDGSEVVWKEMLGGTDPRQAFSQRFMRLASGVRVDTDDIRKRKSTRVFARLSSQLPFRDPANRCTAGGQNERVVGLTSIAGFDAVELRGQAYARWFAPSLNCAELRSKYQWPESRAETEVVEVSAGPPSPELFEVGDDYEEVRPSILYHRGLTDPYGMRLDRAYFARRAQRNGTQK